MGERKRCSHISARAAHGTETKWNSEFGPKEFEHLARHAARKCMVQSMSAIFHRYYVLIERRLAILGFGSGKTSDEDKRLSGERGDEVSILETFLPSSTKI